MKTILAVLTLFLSLNAVAKVNHSVMHLIDGNTALITKISYIDDNDATAKAFPLSQLSDPDGTCEWLGYGTAIQRFVTGQPAEGVVIDSFGAVEDVDMAPLVDEIYCQVRKRSKPTPKKHYKYKTRLTNGDVQILQPVPLLANDLLYRFSKDSNLDGLCKTFGYGKAMAHEVAEDVKDETGDTFGNFRIMEVDASGKVFKVSSGYGSLYSNFKSLGILRAVTCEN